MPIVDKQKSLGKIITQRSTLLTFWYIHGMDEIVYSLGKYVEVLTPVPMNVTLFGNWVSKK